MAIGDEERLNLVDWKELYARTVEDEQVIAGIAFRGRWTAIAAAAKAGKSTLLLGLAYLVAKAGLTVLYLDAEMGRGDILERVEEWMQLQPDDLANLHYSDLPPHIDTVQGASVLGRTVSDVNPDLVVIDGLNGVAQGAENDDTTWRDLFEMAIMPMKQRNIAVVSADNVGRDKTLGPRGHTTKLDKADAILVMERTENGCKLVATHRRSASYPPEQTFIIANASEVGPPLSVRRVEGDYPAGTKELAGKLDNVGIPLDTSRRAARRLLKEAGETAANNLLGAALKYRLETVVRPLSDHHRETPGQIADRSGDPNRGSPPVGTVRNPAVEAVPDDTVDEIF